MNNGIFIKNFTENLCDQRNKSARFAGKMCEIRKKEFNY